jgi:diguanylate cyclase (GGDEF)-like protein
LLTLLINIWIEADISTAGKQTSTILIVGSAFYITFYSFYLIPERRYKDTLIWLNALLSGFGFWLFAAVLPDKLIVYLNLLLFLSVISISTFSGRRPTLVMIALATTAHLFNHVGLITSLLGWVEHLGVPAITVLLSETTIRIQDISRGQIHRLEIINAFSHRVATARDRTQVIDHLNATLPNALIADSYYISALEQDEVHVLICFDDGEFFNDSRVPAEGTLTNWVVQNQQELFRPDLRRPTDIEGVQIVIVGKEKASLSWIGVPMTSRHFRGVLSLASYQPNAFNRGDLELLSNLASHAALAIDNVDRQAELEERAHIDSLTGVLNHGYFIEVLKKQAEASLAHQTPLSLIMLDVDYFKTYNDTYGHLAGDKILTELCGTIRSHIKSTDAVGRWGGEEFIISLPNTNIQQARTVAMRIRQSMREVHLPNREGKTIPAPTVSQGIARFPQETNEIFALIDLADQRLYTAKNRGRDQIETAPSE